MGCPQQFFQRCFLYPRQVWSGTLLAHSRSSFVHINIGRHTHPRSQPSRPPLWEQEVREMGPVQMVRQACNRGAHAKPIDSVSVCRRDIWYSFDRMDLLSPLLLQWKQDLGWVVQIGQLWNFIRWTFDTAFPNLRSWVWRISSADFSQTVRV